MVELQRTVLACGLPSGPFERLIEANRVDQVQTRYETFAQLLGYCQLSAAPVGELVLHVFGAATPERIALSDRVCAGLQVVEHLQDIAEDYARGRIYMPQEDLVRFGCDDMDLAERSQPRDARSSRSRPTAPGGCWPRARRWPARCRRGRGWRSPGSSPEVSRRSTSCRAAGARRGSPTGCSDRRSAGDRPGAGDRALLPPVRADHAARGRELLLRHPPAPPLSAAMRCAPSTRSRGGSTTSATTVTTMTRSCRPCGEQRAMVARLDDDDSSIADPVRVALAHARRVYSLPARRAGAADRGRRARRDRHQRVRDVRPAGRLLPTGGRDDRPVVRRDLHRRPGDRARLAAGRRPRGGDAADQHPARRPRGRGRARPNLPAGRGPAAVRV